MVSTDCYKVYVKVSNLAIKSTVYRNSVVFNDKIKTEYLTIQIIAKEKVEKWVISPQYGFDYDEDENSKTLRKTKMFYSFENQKKKKLEYIFLGFVS